MKRAAFVLAAVLFALAVAERPARPRASAGQGRDRLGGRIQDSYSRFLHRRLRGRSKEGRAGITTLNAYANNFVNSQKCKPVALGQIGRGAGVIFQVASGCGLGALQSEALDVYRSGRRLPRAWSTMRSKR